MSKDSLTLIVLTLVNILNWIEIIDRLGLRKKMSIYGLILGKHIHLLILFKLEHQISKIMLYIFLINHCLPLNFSDILCLSFWNIITKYNYVLLSHIWFYIFIINICNLQIIILIKNGTSSLGQDKKRLSQLSMLFSTALSISSSLKLRS